MIVFSMLYFFINSLSTQMLINYLVHLTKHMEHYYLVVFSPCTNFLGTLMGSGGSLQGDQKWAFSAI